MQPAYAKVPTNAGIVGVDDAEVEDTLRVATLETETGVVDNADMERLPAAVKCGAMELAELVDKPMPGAKTEETGVAELRELEDELPMPGPRTEETGEAELRLLVETPEALKWAAEELTLDEPVDEATTEELDETAAASW